MQDQHSAGAPVAPDFLAAMEKKAVLPLWDRYHHLLPSEPTAPDRPWLWRWADLQGFIERAANDVSMDKAERRVMLVNPDLCGKVAATTNLFAGIQILEPQESARPHRHTASAMRLIMEGEGGSTVVDGKDCPMKQGDLILTPNWAWHEHFNNGKKRVVWLDALDMPLAAHLGAVFSEGAAAYGSNLPTVNGTAFAHAGITPMLPDGTAPRAAMFRYPWTAVMEALDAAPEQPDASRRVRYTNPVDGGPVMATMDCYAWRLTRGVATVRSRSTANAVCLVVDGDGASTIGGKSFSWTKHDVFTVPHWNWTSHRAVSPTAHLFMFTDREVLNGLGLLRDETAAA